MKKALLTTTALAVGGAMLAAGPAAAAEKIRLGLGGFMEQWVGWADNDEGQPGVPSVPDVDQQSDAEVYFRGETTLDNGIEAGVKFEFEGSSSNDGIDESMLYVEGSFGRINLGEEDAASELMQYTAPNVGINFNKSDAPNWIIAPAGFQADPGGGPIASQMDLGTQDAQKITYFTPRIAGFQLGASYTPSTDTNRNNISANDETTETHNGFNFGANYVTKFTGWSLALAGAYATSEAPDGTGDGTNEGYSLGTEIGFGGFTVGGSYMYEDLVGIQWTVWDAGVQYDFGANAVSLGYQSAEAEVAAGTDEHYQIQLAYARTLGPGVTWRNAVMFADWDAANGNENSGLAVVTGIDLTF